MKKNQIMLYLLLLCSATITMYGIVSCNSGNKDVTSPSKNSTLNEQNATQATISRNYNPSIQQLSVSDAVIRIKDAGWQTETGTSDCSNGWSDNCWLLTLTKSYKLTIRATDKYCPGDYFEVYVDGNLIGTTPQPKSWGCSVEGKLSSGCFSINLNAGKHTIKVRDAGFDGHTQKEISNAEMCPAGYYVSGQLSN